MFDMETLVSVFLQREISWTMETEVEVNGSNEYPALYKVMMEKLNEQRQLDQFTDITLIVDGKYSKGHLHIAFSNVYATELFRQ